MLNHEEIRRIHAEERLRLNIRKHIEAVNSSDEKPSDKSNKLMEFLNSSLVIWLLSSVILTGGATVFQKIQHKYQINEQNHQQLMSHLFEIHNRLDNMDYQLRQSKTVGDAKRAMNNLFKNSFPIAPELQGRSLNSLYFSIYNLIPDMEQKKAQEAIEFVRQLEDSEFLLQSRPEHELLTIKDKNNLKKLIAACKSLHLEASIKRI